MDPEEYLPVTLRLTYPHFGLETHVPRDLHECVEQWYVCAAESDQAGVLPVNVAVRYDQPNEVGYRCRPYNRHPNLECTSRDTAL